MIDDERIRRSLTQTGLVNGERVLELEAFARSRALPLYRAAIASGVVTEPLLVSNLAAALGVPSVSLENFTAKPALVDLLPADVVRRHRVVPVGLKPRDGETTLFVAMEDPQDLDALEAISMRCPYPVVPLLAGPFDLDAAVARVYPTVPPSPRSSSQGPFLAEAPPSLAGGASPQPPSRSPLPPPGFGAARASQLPPSSPFTASRPSSLQVAMEPPLSPDAPTPPPRDSASSSSLGGARSRSPHHDLFANVMNDLERSHAPDMLSALSLLDDIPRDRHEVPTSPTGFSAVAEPSGRGRTESSASPPVAPGPPRGTRRPDVAGFSRRPVAASESAVPRMPWEARPTDDLVRALVTLLLRRGLVSQSELLQALDE